MAQHGYALIITVVTVVQTTVYTVEGIVETCTSVPRYTLSELFKEYDVLQVDVDGVTLY
jgi:hypothetical protein